MMSKFKALTEADLDKIFKKFVAGKHRVTCDENHAHGFGCVDFDDETIMVIERLRVEVLLLRGKLKEISDIVKK